MKIEEAIKQKEFPSEYLKLSINLMYTYGWLNSQMIPFLKQFKLTSQQYNVLRILRGQKGKPLGVLAIQDRMLDRMSNASRIVERLRAKHLVERVTCPNDRRSVEITITDLGLDLLQRVDPGISEAHKSIGSSLNEEEAITLNALLDKLRTSKP